MLFPWFIYVLLLIPLVYIAIIDWKEHRIPNKIILPLSAIALLAAWIYGSGIKSLLGGLVGIAILVIPMLLVGQDKLGMGDLKFAIFLGLATGWLGVLFSILSASILAGIYALWGFIKYNFDKSTRIPLAPFFLCGYGLTILGFFLL